MKTTKKVEVNEIVKTCKKSIRLLGKTEKESKTKITNVALMLDNIIIDECVEAIHDGRNCNFCVLKYNINNITYIPIIDWIDKIIIYEKDMDNDSILMSIILTSIIEDDYTGSKCNGRLVKTFKQIKNDYKDFGGTCINMLETFCKEFDIWAKETFTNGILLDEQAKEITKTILSSFPKTINI